MITDKEYVNQLRGIIRHFDLLDPISVDYDLSRCRLLDEIHDLNITWNNLRRWRHWHYIVILIILFFILAFVVCSVIL